MNIVNFYKTNVKRLLGSLHEISVEFKSLSDRDSVGQSGSKQCIKSFGFVCALADALLEDSVML